MYDAGAWSKLVTTCVHSRLVRGLCHSYADAKIESESPASIACIKLILNGKFLDNDEVLAGEAVLRCCSGMATLAFLVLVSTANTLGKLSSKPAADLQRTLTDPAEHSIITMHAIVRPQAALKTPGVLKLILRCLLSAV